MSTIVAAAVNGSMNALAGSGTTSMSLTSIVWKPRIDEPSKPSPSSKASDVRQLTGTEKCCQVPGRSVKRRSTIFTSWSRMAFETSSGVLH